MKENFTGIAVKQDQFELQKVIVNPETKKAKVIAKLDLSTNQVTNITKITIEPDYKINESFQKALSRFKPWLIDVRNLKKDRGNFVKMKSVALSGSGETATWQLVGIQKNDTEQNMKEETAKVHYEAGLYTWEGEILEAIDDLEVEVFEYVFNDARAQLSIFDEKKEAEPDAEQIEEAETVDD